MKRSLALAPAVSLLTFLSWLGIGPPVGAAGRDDWRPPPGWANTRGGEGGSILRVTTLKPRGPGSLAWALESEGPRAIEFAVAGTIDLGGQTLQISHPFLTVAGETAPSPGITLVNGGLLVTTHDIIVRHLRIRPGAGSRPKRSGWEVDGLSTAGGARDVIVDHCSISWATDENLSASGPRFEGKNPDQWRQNTSHRITFHRCLIAECLHDSTHPKGPHSKGSLIHDNVTGIAVVGNLYISNDDRNPLFKGGARGAVMGNLIHNPGRRAVSYALVPSEWGERAWEHGTMLVVGNVVRQGPDSAPEMAFLRATGPLDIYMADNLFLDREGRELPAEAVFRGPLDPETGEPDAPFRVLNAPPFDLPGWVSYPVSETAERVLKEAGARPWDRDATDARLVEEARHGGGRIIDREADAGQPRPVPAR